MPRRVFFSFHYVDVWRVMQVRNAWAVRGTNEATGFVDKADFEQVQRQGAGAIERWIDRQLEGTSVTVALIGADTAHRPYVQYEIRRSYERGNRLLGIWIDSIKDQDGKIAASRGDNPFEVVRIGSFFFTNPISSLLDVRVYDWVRDQGRHSIARWIESAPRRELAYES
jgi:hypothetical protein